MNFIRSRGLILWLAVGAMFGSGIPARAVIFFTTDDPAYNTSAPSGDLAGSGWQFQGQWGGFLGTPIAGSYFITASHVGGAVGDRFIFAGITYSTTEMFDDPNSDLRIWRVCGTFPAFAALYANRDEVGKGLVVFGRGTLRGSPVVVSSLLGDELKGWRWAASDGAPRWGENRVGSVANGDAILPLLGVNTGGVGELLKASFDANGGPNEAHLSGGDSGGAVFIKDGSIWKLAAINYGVDGPYNVSASGAGFFAAVFDEGGLFKGGEGKWVLTLDLPLNQPGGFYATRISSHLDWINSVISAPGGPEKAPLLQVAENVAGPYTAHPTAMVAPADRTVIVRLPDRNQFYRLVSCESLRIIGVTIEGDKLRMNYAAGNP